MSLDNLDTPGVDCRRVFMWSDGCAAQYKCKVNLADLSSSMYAGHDNIELNYIGSEHGKGAAMERLAASTRRQRSHALGDGLSLIRGLTGISFA